MIPRPGSVPGKREENAPRRNMGNMGNIGGKGVHVEDAEGMVWVGGFRGMGGGREGMEERGCF